MVNKFGQHFAMNVGLLKKIKVGLTFIVVMKILAFQKVLKKVL